MTDNITKMLTYENHGWLLIAIVVVLLIVITLYGLFGRPNLGRPEDPFTPLPVPPPPQELGNTPTDYYNEKIVINHRVGGIGSDKSLPAEIKLHIDKNGNVVMQSPNIKNTFKPQSDGTYVYTIKSSRPQDPTKIDVYTTTLTLVKDLAIIILPDGVTTYYYRMR